MPLLTTGNASKMPLLTTGNASKMPLGSTWTSERLCKNKQKKLTDILKCNASQPLYSVDRLPLYREMHEPDRYTHQRGVERCQNSHTRVEKALRWRTSTYFIYTILKTCTHFTRVIWKNVYIFHICNTKMCTYIIHMIWQTCSYLIGVI